MTHAHGISGGEADASRDRRPLKIAFGLVLSFLIVQVAAGFWTGSLALLSDAGHMASDALGIGMALGAVVAANQASVKGSRTYGLYRLEILAALANAGLVFGVGAYVVLEAFKRWGDPSDVDVVPMLVVAILGLVVNVVVWRILRSGAEASLNMEGAMLEAVADLAGSVAVIIAAIVIATTGWVQADAVVAAAIGLFVLPRAWRLGRRALRVILQFTPEGLDIDAVRRDLMGLEGVVDVHDLHVWTLTSSMDVASVHLMTTTTADPHRVLDQARSMLASDFGIEHATLQVEPHTHEGCTELAY
ncbi:MAG: cation transporter [Acidimicrobiia bacterium]|nr:cation transporter [Acidimicrobiia bacterium]